MYSTGKRCFVNASFSLHSFAILLSHLNTINMNKDKGNKNPKKGTADNQPADKKKVASDYKSEGKSKGTALSPDTQKPNAKGGDSSKRK
jgi:hypothetical protein